MSKGNKNIEAIKPVKPPLAVVILALVALALSSYLAWHSLLKGSQLAGCGEGSTCDDVIQTRWGSWFGLPVSVGGALIYAAILGISISLRKKFSERQWLTLLGVSIVAAASAIWFIALQIFVVKSYCWYCMAVHACGIITSLLVLANFPFAKEVPGKKKPTFTGVPAKPTVMAIIAGLAGVAVLAAGQLHTPGATPPPVAPKVQTTTAPATNPATAVSREVLLGGGKLRISMGDFPMFGSPDAPNVVAHFFDFTCPACREFHSQLMTSHQPVENTTALVMIPVPLDAECNPALQQTAYSHQNSCNFSKIGLALWSIQPEYYYSFDQYMFQGQYPPPINAALAYAENLAGREALSAALGNPRINEILRTGLTLFYSPALTQKALPALAAEKEVVVGFPPAGMLPRIFASR